MAWLSIDQPIGFFDEVKVLSDGHPVFLISCSEDNSNLIIKMEHGKVQEALKYNLKVMSKISSAVSGSKLLSDQELESIRGFLRVSQMTANAGLWTETEDIKTLRKTFSTAGTWFKMKKIDGIQGLEEAILKLKNDRDKSGVRAIAKSLNDPGGFEKMGQVLAADLYNHNVDRFSWYGKGITIPGTNEKFKTIINLGNVLFAIEKEKLQPVGLDSFFVWSEYKKVDEPLYKLKDASAKEEDWGGYWLARNAKSKRKTFAQDVFDDLQIAVGPRDRKFFLLNADFRSPKFDDSFGRFS